MVTYIHAEVKCWETTDIKHVNMHRHISRQWQSLSRPVNKQLGGPLEGHQLMETTTTVPTRWPLQTSVSTMATDRENIHRNKAAVQVDRR